MSVFSQNPPFAEQDALIVHGAKNFRNRGRVLKEEEGPCARSVPSHTKVVGNLAKEWSNTSGSYLVAAQVRIILWDTGFLAKLVANETRSISQSPSTPSQWPFLGHRRQQRVRRAPGQGVESRWENNETWPRRQPLSRRKVPPPLQDGQPESAPVKAFNRQSPPCLPPRMRLSFP